VSSKRELEAAETLDATVPPSASDGPVAIAATQAGDSAKLALETRFPVEDWDHYEFLNELGKGGMGAVYRARDKRLDRIVALKFILGAHPNLVMRFLQEARAQARIDHPNVCHVYEVGEVHGRAYIAMQFVDGEQLGKAAAKMSLDEKVAVMRDVAAAIHEAHKLGIIHRDLKPANILVEHGEDGRWFPVVMDFGLAREATVEAGLTESGALLGTPAYMSPEQARGEQRAVDRRSDVYSLGATFYELITGRPPFSPTSLAAALEQIMSSDPAAPRSLVSTVPLDLETIALKCLAKEPSRRYASARALADDLERYLDGEPILGRRPSLWHRLRLRARRNRALVGVSLSSLVVIMVLAGLGARAGIMSRRERARAAERARLAEALGQDAKEIEWLLRGAYQLPLHDTTPERELIRERMRRIAGTRHDLGALGEATIHGALGRGHLALHEWSEAADELARAAEAPGLHAARGRALGELYHRAVEDARRSGDPAWLAQRKKELEQKYLAPALVELERSRADGESTENTSALEALVALYRQDYALAEQRALAAVARAPWLFEARKIAADAAYEAAVEKFDRGSYDEARAGLEHASDLYAQAAEVARSDATVHEAAAEAWLKHADVDARQGRPTKDPVDRALGAIDRAATSDPRNAVVYTTKALTLLNWYRSAPLDEAERQRLLDRIAAAAARAVEIDPRDAAAWEALGYAHINRGTFAMFYGKDPLPWLDKARDEIGTALRLQPNYPWANNDLGLVHRWLCEHAMEVGSDPMPEFEAAMRAYERAVTLDPRFLFAWENQVDLLSAIAEYQVGQGRDPTVAVQGARRAGERALAIDPNYARVLDVVAVAELSLAEYRLLAGLDPTEPLELARRRLSDSLAKSPGRAEPYFYRLLAAIIDARHARAKRRDPADAVALGRSALRDALHIEADCAQCFIRAAQLDLVAAGPSDVTVLEKALADARHAVKLNATLAETQIVAAEACLRLAAAQDGRAAPSVLREGLSHVKAALAVNARDPQALVVHAALLVAESRATGDGQAREAARAEATRALAINPLLRNEWGEALREVLPK
jgi:serine/threonine-protein kinase